MGADNDDQHRDPVIDKATRELRRVFVLVNRESSKQEASAEDSAKQADKVAAKTAKRLLLKERKKQKAAREAALAEILQSLTRRAKCAECSAELPAISDDFTPRICKKCLDRNAALSLDVRPRSSTQYTEIQIFPGGSPGSGRRK
ncbi:MAG: hypothetical protein K2X80_16175 [Pseudomonadaceae bacterium]|nr:hypothetical protein [Pseudomonadaceae bacterium]